MALSAFGLYCANFKSIIDNDVAMDWLADANKVALVNNSATPNFDSDTTWTDSGSRMMTSSHTPPRKRSAR